LSLGSSEASWTNQPDKPTVVVEDGVNNNFGYIIYSRVFSLNKLNKKVGLTEFVSEKETMDSPAFDENLSSSERARANHAQKITRKKDAQCN